MSTSSDVSSLSPIAPVDADGLSRALLPFGQSTMLPVESYTSQAVLDWERRNFVAGSWACVGRVEELRADGATQRALLVGDIPAAIADIHRRCEIAGRDPASIELSMFAWQPPSLERLDQFRSWGITRTVLFAPVKPRDEVLRFLDTHAALVQHGRQG